MDVFLNGFWVGLMISDSVQGGGTFHGSMNTFVHILDTDPINIQIVKCLSLRD